jgi:hypothetical protein
MHGAKYFSLNMDRIKIEYLLHNQRQSKQVEQAEHLGYNHLVVGCNHSQTTVLTHCLTNTIIYHYIRVFQGHVPPMPIPLLQQDQP